MVQFAFLLALHHCPFSLFTPSRGSIMPVGPPSVSSSMRTSCVLSLHFVHWSRRPRKPVSQPNPSGIVLRSSRRPILRYVHRSERLRKPVSQPNPSGIVLRSSRRPILRYVHRSERLWMPLSQPNPSGQLQW